MNRQPPHSRRQFLHHATRLAAAGSLPVFAAPAMASIPKARGLALSHTHTGERIDLVYAVDERYVPEALGSLNRFLRDHYSGLVGSIDPQLFDLMHRVREVLGTERPFEVISGYRDPQTNEHLRQTRGGGVARRSLHMDGRAIDVRVTGVSLADLRDAALSLRAGGVGYYPGSRFVHLDTGRVRNW
jgi:uncharacterized protein YcbK (DUF882 family)